MDICHVEIEKSIFIRLACFVYVNISMNIHHLDMVESSAAEFSAAEVTFLAFRAQYSAEEAPRCRHR